MRKVALLSAVVLAAAFSSTPSIAQSAPPAPGDFYKLNENTFKFMAGPGMEAQKIAPPAMAAPGAPAAAAPAMKHKHKHKHMKKKM